MFALSCIVVSTYPTNQQYRSSTKVMKASDLFATASTSKSHQQQQQQHLSLNSANQKKTSFEFTKRLEKLKQPQTTETSQIPAKNKKAKKTTEQQSKAVDSDNVCGDVHTLKSRTSCCSTLFFASVRFRFATTVVV